MLSRIIILLKFQN